MPEHQASQWMIKHNTDKEIKEWKCENKKGTKVKSALKLSGTSVWSLSLFIVPLGGMLLHCKVSPRYSSAFPDSSFSWGEEKHYKSQVSRPRTQHNDPATSRTRFHPMTELFISGDMTQVRGRHDFKRDDFRSTWPITLNPHLSTQRPSQVWTIRVREEPV